MGPHTAIITTLRNKNPTKYYLVPRILQAVPAAQVTSYFGHGASGTPTTSGLSLRLRGVILGPLAYFEQVDSYIQLRPIVNHALLSTTPYYQLRPIVNKWAKPQGSGAKLDSQV